jgi:hypothetical protein
VVNDGNYLEKITTHEIKLISADRDVDAGAGGAFVSDR